MDVRIGVTYTGRELEVEMPDDADRNAISASVDAAISGTNPTLWLTDRKGKTIGVPADKIAYIEIGRDKSERRVGFGE